MPHARPKRSAFVTVVAWAFLLSSSWAILALVASWPWHQSGFYDEIDDPPPEVQRARQRNEEIIARTTKPALAVIVTIPLPTFVASLGLLRRKNWARVMFIGTMGYAVLALAAVIVLMSALQTLTAGTLVPRLAPAVAFGWIAWKLRSPPIVEEFHSEKT
jgi:hypothetical protein